MDLLNKIIDFLTANPFDEEDAENRQLHNELNRQKSVGFHGETKNKQDK